MMIIYGAEFNTISFLRGAPAGARRQSDSLQQDATFFIHSICQANRAAPR
jgi:hypothetical protein